MSALGQKRTSGRVSEMSALPPKADIAIPEKRPLRAAHRSSKGTVLAMSSLKATMLVAEMATAERAGG